MRQFQFCGAADGDRGAQHTAGVLQHEVHHFRRYLLCCTDEVALVFAVFIIYHNDKLAFLEVGQSLFDSIQFECFHISLDLLILNS